MRKILTPKQQFDHQCALVFEALAIFDDRVTPANVQEATLAASSTDAADPQSLPPAAIQEISAAMRISSPVAVLEERFEVAKIAAASISQGAPTDEARQKMGHGVSVAEYFFQQAYAAACAQEASRVALAGADRGDESIVACAREKLEGALAGTQEHPSAVALQLFASKLEGVEQRLERALLDRQALGATKSGGSPSI